MYTVIHPDEYIELHIVRAENGQAVPDAFYLVEDDAYGFGPTSRMVTRAEALVALYEFSNQGEGMPHGIPGFDYDFGKWACHRQFGDVSYCSIPGCGCPFGPA